MTVKELMSTNIYYIKADASASDAAVLMKKQDIGFLPVCDNKGCVLGLVTDRDLVLRAFSALENPEALPVSEIMSKDIVSITSDLNIHDAACIFAEKKVHRLPVLENSRLVGVLSISDLAKKRLFLAEVGDIMGSIAKV